MKGKEKKTKPGIKAGLSPGKGFTLIETLVSLFLILIGVLFVTRTIIFSLDLNKKSLLRLKLGQKYENQIHSLLSKSYDSEKLQPGNHSSPEDPFRIKWTVSPITSTLKKIDISVSYKQLIQRGYFYKSKTIQTVSDI